MAVTLRQGRRIKLTKHTWAGYGSEWKGREGEVYYLRNQKALREVTIATRVSKSLPDLEKFVLFFLNAVSR
ncbi:MAG: hypothetical protein QW607_09750 [Desulfurococcaceae archaeon]